MTNDSLRNRNPEPAITSGATTYGTSGWAAIKRISWGAVFAGLIIAMVIQLALSMLGLGIGFGALSPMETGEAPTGLDTGALIWWVVSSLISLFVGGWVAGRLAGMPKAFDSILHGLLTWSLVTLLSFYLITTAVGRIISGVGNVVGQTLSLAGQGIAAVAPEAGQAIQNQLESQGININDLKREAMQLLEDAGKPELQPEALEREAQQAASEAEQTAGEAAENPQSADASLSDLFEGLVNEAGEIASAADREAAVNVVMERTGKSRQESQEIVNNWVQTFEQAKANFEETKEEVALKARKTAEDVKSAVSKAGIFGFIALVLGAAAAGFGGKLGEPKDIMVEDHGMR